MRVEVTFSPESVKANTSGSAEMTVTVFSTSEYPMWYEMEVKVPPALSLLPAANTGSARSRIGIADGREAVSKTIKVHTDHNTSPHLYKVDITVFGYDKGAVIKDRADTHAHLRVES